MAALIADVAAARRPRSRRADLPTRRDQLHEAATQSLAPLAGSAPSCPRLGLSSPVDYIVNSILIPDQAIKEEYETRVVISTDDGLTVFQGIVVEDR